MAEKGRGSTVAFDAMALQKGLDGAGGWIRQVVLSTSTINGTVEAEWD
jgi:hypothetical protein